MSLPMEGREVLGGLEAKEDRALLIMVTVSVLSREDSPLCSNLASMLFFFQIHEVKRVTTLPSASGEVCYSATHPSLRGWNGRGRIWAGPLIGIHLSTSLPQHPLPLPSFLQPGQECKGNGKTHTSQKFEMNFIPWRHWGSRGSRVLQ